MFIGCTGNLHKNHFSIIMQHLSSEVVEEL